MTPASEFPWRDNLEIIAESIETLCTVEMTCIGPGRGIVRPLYEAVRAAYNGFPTLLAARALTARVSPGDPVVLSTGVVIPGYLPTGESDGPAGIAVMARLLARRLGRRAADPVRSRGDEPPITAACAALGLATADMVHARPDTHTVAIEPFPAEAEAADGAAARVLDELRPSALIVAEKLGVNRLGVPHTSTGKRLSGPRAPIERLVDAARPRGVLTIGIGDNGNEIGFGVIADAVAEHKPYGRICQCGCGGGLACANTCDFLITATISNWGCYGLAAMLASLLDQPALVPTGSHVLNAIAASVDAGAVDGATGEALMAVDGVPAAIEAGLVDMLGTIVRMALTTRRPRSF